MRRLRAVLLCGMGAACTSTPTEDAGVGIPDSGSATPLQCDSSATDGLPFFDRVDIQGTKPTFASLGVQRGTWQLEGVHRYGPPIAGASHRSRFLVRGNYWQLTRETADAGVFFAAGTIFQEAPRLVLTHACPTSDDSSEFEYTITDGGKLFMSVRGSTTVDVYARIAE